MKILITMAGKGSRFRNAGASVPKHEIIVKDRPMFDWAMQSLTAFFDEEFIFVTQSAHSPSEFLSDACERLGIDTYREIPLNDYTNGQAATAFAADEVIDDDESVVIYNIDTYIEENEITPTNISGDGFIPVFKAAGDRWSFVSEAPDGTAQRVSEKRKISDLATAGFYYFATWSNFVDAFETAASNVEAEYGETFVAPLYNHLIDRGHSIHTHQIESDAVHVLGTPDDLREFYPSFDPKKQ